MTEFNASDVTAKDLMQDDRFEIGGEMYRISKIVKNLDERVIHFYPIRNVTRTGTLVIPSDTKFKIFNQK